MIKLQSNDVIYVVCKCIEARSQHVTNPSQRARDTSYCCPFVSDHPMIWRFWRKKIGLNWQHIHHLYLSTVALLMMFPHSQDPVIDWHCTLARGFPELAIFWWDTATWSPGADRPVFFLAWISLILGMLKTWLVHVSPLEKFRRFGFRVSSKSSLSVSSVYGARWGIRPRVVLRPWNKYLLGWGVPTSDSAPAHSSKNRCPRCPKSAWEWICSPHLGQWGGQWWSISHTWSMWTSCSIVCFHFIVAPQKEPCEVGIATLPGKPRSWKCGRSQHVLSISEMDLMKVGSCW